MLMEIFDADTDATRNTTDTAQDSTDTRTPEAVPTLSLTVIFEVLRNARRRYVLREIANHEDGDGIAFGDLVDHVAAEEQGAEVGTVDSGTRKAVYTSLYQSHLPKLDDMGVISYDRRSGPVRAGPHLDEVLNCLDAVEGTRSRPPDDDHSEKGWTSIRAAVGL